MSLSGTLAVLSQSSKTLSFFDLTSGSKVFVQSDLAAEPHELAYDAKRNVLYISHTYRHGHYYAHGVYSHEISVFDIHQEAIVDVIDISPFGGPHGLQIDPVNDILYSTVEHGLGSGSGSDGSNTGGLVGIHLDTRKIVKQVASGAKTHWFILTRDCQKAYTINKTAPFISALNLDTGERTTDLPVPGSEEGALSLDGKHAFLAGPGLQLPLSLPQTGGWVKVIDTATDEILRTIETPLGVASVFVTARNQLMVVQYGFEPDSSRPGGGVVPKAGRVGIYDGKTFGLVGEVEVGCMPLTVRASPDGAVGFVANVTAGTVSVIDLEQLKVLQTLDVDTVPKAGADAAGFHQGAHGLALIP